MSSVLGENNEVLRSEWLAEVRTVGEEEDNCAEPETGGGEHCRWRHLADWEERYERSPGYERAPYGDGIQGDGSMEPSPSSKGDEPEPRSRKEMLDSLGREMELKILDILQEVLATLLGLAEKEAWRNTAPGGGTNGVGEESRPSSTDASEAISPSTVPRILNNLDAVTLSYRFERHGPAKFAYIRRIASDQTADLIRLYLEAFESDEQATSTVEKISTLQHRARSFVDAESARAKGVAVGLIDDRVTKAADEALDGALAVTQEKLDEAGAKLEAAGVGGTEVAMPSSLAIDMALNNQGGTEKGESSEHHSPTHSESTEMESRIEKLRHAVADGTKKLKHAVAEKGAETKAVMNSKEQLGEKAVQTLGGLVVRIMTRGINGLLKSAVAALDGLIENLAEVHEDRAARAASNGGQIDENLEKQVVRDETFHFVERMHADLEGKAKSDTAIAVKVIGATMGDEQLEALVNRLRVS